MDDKIKKLESDIIEHRQFEYFEVIPSSGWIEMAWGCSFKRGSYQKRLKRKKKLFVFKLKTKKSLRIWEKPPYLATNQKLGLQISQGFVTNYDIQSAKCRGFASLRNDYHSYFFALTPKALEKLKSKKVYTNYQAITLIWKVKSKRPFDDLKAKRAKLYCLWCGKIYTPRGKLVLNLLRK